MDDKKVFDAYKVAAAMEEKASHNERMRENETYFERAFSAFGFTGTTVDAHGRAEREEFLDCETFFFNCGKKNNLENANHLTIGRGPNGKWTYGLSLCTSNTGMGYWLSVFRIPYDSRNECLRHGLEEVIAWHTKENDKRTTAIIKEAKDMLDDITGRKQKQLSLF